MANEFTESTSRRTPEESQERERLRKEFASLKGNVADLSSISGERRRKEAAPELTQALSIPFWQIRERSGGTYTAGTDWNPQFDDNNATDAVDYDIPTATGWFVMTISLSSPARARISFNSPMAFSISVNITADNWSANAVQTIVNGEITQLSGGTNDTWDFQKGRNQIDIMGNGGPNSIEFRGRLFGRAGITWVNPYA